MFLDLHLELGYAFLKKGEYFNSELHYKIGLKMLDDYKIVDEKEIVANKKKRALIFKNLAMSHLNFGG